ncbi:DUF2281 domain-containing protein [Aerosakkonemataceae cyanobacterium BLCC-F50]|uniref:DUF2281 domain-containing protein n=1 Tax=Floridaenema flaviceps BLCC-F50 TaxID=3153642 RepID=A0ABV4XZI6_9CYAN
MINPLIEKEIFTQLNKLSDEQQQQVLDFARFLARKNPVGVPGKELLKFAGTISHEDAKIMLEAAEENWGQADLKTWCE